VDHPSGEDLLAVPLFAGLGQSARDTLAAALEIEDHPAGKVLVRQGRAGYAFYVLQAGEAVVTVDGEPVRKLGPGEFFGEIAILGSGRRTATITAVTPVIVWALFGTTFRRMERDHPAVAAALEQAMQDKLDAGHTGPAA
jgi:CRP/FNR family transcriptional regulator, cyclic AMP receptor protein